MSRQMSEEELYNRAKKVVEDKKGFYIHLTVYLVVNAVIFAIWMFSMVPFPWFIFPLGGWGIGVLFHFLSVFFFNRETGWERRQIEKEMDRMRGKHD